MTALRFKRFHGLRPGSLPFKIAQLAIGESTLIECEFTKRVQLLNRVALANKAKAISHMRFAPQIFHCVDLTAPDTTTCIVKVTRIEDRNPESLT